MNERQKYERQKYLELLINKEDEAEYNHKAATKAYLQTKAIKAAATRERIAFEKGMEN